MVAASVKIKGRVQPLMKLPPDVEWVEGANLFIWRPRGVLEEAQVNKILSFLINQEKISEKSFNRFTDTSGLEAIHLTFKYVFHVALYRRLSRVGQPVVKSAFLVTDPQIGRYLKLHALVTDRSPLQVRLFKERTAAAKWLGVKPELLEPPP
jgi:hypothetical protein